MGIITSWVHYSMFYIILYSIEETVDSFLISSDLFPSQSPTCLRLASTLIFRTEDYAISTSWRSPSGPELGLYNVILPVSLILGSARYI
jgi:hypothetical protein